MSSLNSLVGTTADDGVGAQVIALGNGSYVVGGPDWSGKIGAAPWGNGTNGNPKGSITALNSLVGSNANDAVGGITTRNSVSWARGSVAAAV